LYTMCIKLYTYTDKKLLIHIAIFQSVLKCHGAE